jgi:hypothetical protein
MPANVDLNPDKFDVKQSTASSFFVWLSSTGKYILLIANIFLFFLFMYRFSVDRDVVLLTRDIKDLHVSITANENKALEYDDLQSIVQRVVLENEDAIESTFILNLLTVVTPSGIEILSVDAAATQLSISAISKGPESFSRFIDYFLSEPAFKSVSLSNSTYDINDDSFRFVLLVGL